MSSDTSPAFNSESLSSTASRFGGTARLYGLSGYQTLTQSHVCVVGIGGVGSWAAEALARTAIGRITLIDMDDVCVTNTNRQIIALQSSVGMSKVEVMADRIRQISPHCQVTAIADFVTRQNVTQYLTRDIDFVIDAIDSVGVKAALIGHCHRNKIKIVTIGGAGGQIDPCQITVGDLNKTVNDPLARKLRSLLRRDYGFSRNPKRTYGIPCVYSREQLRYPLPNGEICQAKSVMEGSTRLDCTSGFGASTMVTATFGFVAVARVVEKLIDKAQRNGES
jgi:tRNA A37 threonylcarbamoyladenosine dehydratase